MQFAEADRMGCAKHALSICAVIQPQLFLCSFSDGDEEDRRQARSLMGSSAGERSSEDDFEEQMANELDDMIDRCVWGEGEGEQRFHGTMQL